VSLRKFTEHSESPAFTSLDMSGRNLHATWTFAAMLLLLPLTLLRESVDDLRVKVDLARSGEQRSRVMAEAEEPRF
jgi:hypothetical protein